MKYENFTDSANPHVNRLQKRIVQLIREQHDGIVIEHIPEAGFKCNDSANGAAADATANVAETAVEENEGKWRNVNHRTRFSRLHFPYATGW